VRDFEISEFLEIRELEIPNTADPLSNRSVKGNDPAMDAGMGD
jgi:hypothetical protein